MAQGENIKDSRKRPAKKPPKKITERYLYNSGLAYLQRFPASTPHFRRIMGRKIDRSCNYHKEQNREECLTLLESAIQTFERQGLLNDAAYLQGMVTSLRRRGLSTQAILSKLQQKGLPQEAILPALSSYDTDNAGIVAPDMAAAILLIRRKKLGVFRSPGREENMNRELSALARAGFGFDIAQKALSMGIEEAEEILYSQRT